MKQEEYKKPQIKTCDYMAKNGLMIGIGEGSGDQQFGKEASTEFYDDAAGETETAPRSVWDE